MIDQLGQSLLVQAVDKKRTISSRWKVLHEILFRTSLAIHLFNLGFCCKYFVHNKISFKFMLIFSGLAMTFAVSCVVVYLIKFEEIQE